MRNNSEGEGFYIGSSKGISEGGQKALAHNIVIEDCILGPRLLGQYFDIKYAASYVVARKNVLYCYEKTYNEEVVKLAGFANVIEDNVFIGSNENLTRYVYILNNSPADPVLVDYLGQQDIPAPTGRDNSVVNNVFYTDNFEIEAVNNAVAPIDRPTVVVENNLMKPLEAASQAGLLKTLTVQGFTGVSTTLEYNEFGLSEWTDLETRIPESEDSLTFEIEPENDRKQGFYRVAYERDD